ncbi:protease modulator HflC [bacterium]|nr:protease modulator HflC [candidate division CSSED10-310 bacterium]
MTVRQKWMMILGSAAVLVILASISLYTVKADQYAVITSFGRPGAIRLDPGLYFKWPTPFSIVNRFDRRLQLYQTALIEYLTGDKKNLIIQTYVCWRIQDPLLFFQTTRDIPTANQKLDDILCSYVASTLGDNQMNQIISAEPGQVVLEDIVKKIQTDTDQRAQSFGIRVEMVDISRLALPEDNARSVYRRMIAERSAIANEYRAIGQQKAAEIRAQADREKSEILSAAYKEAEIIRGEGDAMAARIYGSSYSKAPEFFKFVRTLEADKKILDDKSMVILSSESDLLQVLKTGSGK